MREALLDQSLGLKITNQVGTNSRTRCPAKYVRDLDFADKIMLISDNTVNAQKQLDLVGAMSRRLG
jgi:hypothetical protein